MLNRLRLTTADNYAPLTLVDFQFLDEFVTAVHGLELEVSVDYADFVFELFLFPGLDFLHFVEGFDVEL